MVSHLSYYSQKPLCLSVGMTSIPNRVRVAVDQSRSHMFQSLCSSGGNVIQWWQGPERARTCEVSCSMRVLFVLSQLFLSYHCAIDGRCPSSERCPVTAPDYLIMATKSTALWPVPSWRLSHSRMCYAGNIPTGSNVLNGGGVFCYGCKLVHPKGVKSRPPA